MIATLWEVWEDRHGDLYKSQDVIIRIALLLAEAIALHFIFIKPLIDSLFLSIAVFFMFFDYLIAMVLIKNGVVEPRRGTTYTWWTYTAKSGVFDNLKLWKDAKPWTKFFIKLGALIAAVIIFLA